MRRRSVLTPILLAGTALAGWGGAGPGAGTAPVSASTTAVRVAATAATAPAAITVRRGPAGAAHHGPRRPAIAWDPIPFGAKRKAETAAYARRHYGVATWRLRHPRVIVEHYTVNNSVSATLATFAADLPDVELHELPGVCSHFVVGRRGDIHQLVPLGVMCRHTVGLNDRSIGIEHVGMTAQQVLADRAQLRSSLRLTAWLRCRYGIPVRDVIGHAESLGSPYHHERVAALRHQTHSDWTTPEMRRYRRLLRARPCAGSHP